MSVLRCSQAKSSGDRVVKRSYFSSFKAEGPARKVRKSLVLDLWGKDCLSDQQLFEEQLNNAQVSWNKDVGEKVDLLLYADDFLHLSCQILKLLPGKRPNTSATSRQERTDDDDDDDGVHRQRHKLYTQADPLARFVLFSFNLCIRFAAVSLYVSRLTLSLK